MARSRSRVRVSAPPDLGKANRAMIAALARAGGLPGSAFSLAAGETGRNRTILVTGNPAAVEAWMAEIVNVGKEK